MRLITATAPIRICDNGGWTDTWFAGHGEIFHIAVTPTADVRLVARPRRRGEPPVLLHAANYGTRHEIDPANRVWGAHPLLEAALHLTPPPADLAIDLTVSSAAPAGASTGTSAAVTVALLGALAVLNGHPVAPHTIARQAWQVETELLGGQCGIQDQLCAAYGGINLITMSRYPDATVTPVRLPPATLRALEARLLLIFLGKSHSSSAVHQQVIRELEDSGPQDPRLAALRRTAAPSREALLAGDFAAFGRILIANTAAQRALHPDLVGADAQRVIDLAQAHGMAGWKVNGAGGDGGSVTLLGSGDAAAQVALVQRLEAEGRGYRPIPIRLSPHGLRTRQELLP
jgi:D-glycero-alpha-D-manno-heptose-7-phosphate kinase